MRLQSPVRRFPPQVIRIIASSQTIRPYRFARKLRSIKMEADNNHEDIVWKPPPRQRPQNLKKPNREPRPSHFLAIPLAHHPSLTTAISDIQMSIVSHSPHLKETLVDSVAAHLTLGVLSLPDTATKTKAVAALEKAAEEAAIEASCSSFSIKIQGVGNFRDEVVFLKVAENETLLRFAAALRCHFHEQGLLLQANRDFVPHITVAKCSKMQQYNTTKRRKNKHQPSSKWNRKTKSGGKSVETDVEMMDNDGIAPLVEDTHEEEMEEEEEEDSSFATERPNKEERNEKRAPFKIPFEAYALHEHVCIEDAVAVQELQLCAMQGRAAGEYYQILHRVPL